MERGHAHPVSGLPRWSRRRWHVGARFASATLASAIGGRTFMEQTGEKKGGEPGRKRGRAQTQGEEQERAQSGKCKTQISFGVWDVINKGKDRRGCEMHMKQGVGEL